MTNKVLIYTDPHLGLTRKANFTPDSVERREKATGHTLYQLLRDHPGPSFCLGDFFDKESNPEAVILEAIPIAERTDIIMAGNHDVPNRSDKESSLRLLGEILPNRVLIADQQLNEGFTTEVGDTLFCFAPHALTQEGYDDMIEGLCRSAQDYLGRHQILCLHCNYDLPEAFGNEHTLNLTKDRARELLGYFHHILIGHVHNSSLDYGGRVQVIGSTAPTAFDNMEDKRVLLYNPANGEMENKYVWSAQDSFFYGPASDVADNPLNYEYFDLVDDMPPGEAQKLAVSLFNDGAFGVRLRRSEEGQDPAAPALSPGQFDNLPATIEGELKEKLPHLLPLWQELRGLQQ